MNAPVWLRTRDALPLATGDDPPGSVTGPQPSAPPSVLPEPCGPSPTLQALTDVLARAEAEDAARHPAHPLAWQVLCLRIDGSAGLFDLVARPRRAGRLRPGRGGVRLTARPSRPEAATLTLPEGLDGYAAVVVVEHTEGSGSRRLQEAGQACWRAATAAGFDAALVTATPPAADGASPAWRDPVVAVGIGWRGAPDADHAFRMGDR